VTPPRAPGIAGVVRSPLPWLVIPAVVILVAAALTPAQELTRNQGDVGLYLGNAGVASGFGAAGSLVLLIVWVYYSAQIFLLGAEFTWVYARAHGSHAANVARSDAVAAPIPGQQKAAETGCRGNEVPVLLRP